MTPKEFRICYLAFINLYGAIYSDEAFLVMKEYFPSLKKKEMYKDMKSRLHKLTRGYEIVSTTDNKYVIKADYYSYEDLDKLFKEQENKPIFVPDSFIELSRYASNEYWFDDNEKILDEMCDFLAKRINSKDETEKAAIIMNIIYSIRVYIENLSILDSSKYFELLEKYHVEIKDQDDAYKFLKIFQSLNNNTRTHSNRGYTPKELSNLRGPIDLENVKLTIGPNLRKRLIEEVGALEEYIEMVKSSNIPNLAKHSLLMECDDIRKEIKANKVKA